jgi:hypothetical protein
MSSGAGVKTFRRKAEPQGLGTDAALRSSADASAPPQPKLDQPLQATHQHPKPPHQPLTAQAYRRDTFGLSTRRCSVLVPPVNAARLAELSGLMRAADPLASRKASRKQQEEREAGYLRSALELAVQYEEVSGRGVALQA